MPFMVMRAAAVLAAGFLITGPSHSAPGAARTGGATGGTTAITPGQCPAHWTADDLPVPPLPASPDSGSIQSMAALSATDAFAFVDDYPGPDVYHLTHGAWQKLVRLNGYDPYFAAATIVAKSDTDVWVVRTSETATATHVPDAWHFDGSTWTDHQATLSPQAEIQGAALGSNGVLYVTGGILGPNPNGPERGIVWAYNGSGWSDLTPANPRYQYGAVTVTADGTLVVGASNGLLQERSGTTWTTVRLSAPVTAITGISASPDGTVYATGAGAGNQPVLIEQRPGSRSAAVLDVPPAPGAAPTTTERAVVAAGQGDVWLLGQGPSIEPVNGIYVPVRWITHFDGRRFVVATAPDFSVVDGISLGPDILAYGAAVNPATGGSTQTFIAVCPVQVTRDAIIPPHQRTPIGAQMFWSVPATGSGSRHELVAPGMFDSGPLSPGGSFEEDLFAAATYRVRDTATGAIETVGVPATVAPASGVTSTVFTVTCASLQAPAGYAYRLLVERPGSPRYTLLTTTSQPTATFLPYDGTGTYRFECQVQTPTGVTAASPPAAVSVSLLWRLQILLRKIP